MQTCPFCLGVLLLLSAGLAAVPSPAAPASAPAKRAVVPDTGLSYVPPLGWQTDSTSSRIMNNEFCHAAFAGSFEANFSIGVRGSTASADHYLQEKAAEIMENTPALHVQSRVPFVTASGLRGERAVLDVRKPGTPRATRTILYVLAAPQDQKICVITEALSSDGTKYDAALDACVKTFTVK